MTNTEHTPGPWRVDPECPQDIRDADGFNYVASTATEPAENEALMAEARANAVLIAAAPDLLAALQDIAALNSTLHTMNGLKVAASNENRQIKTRIAELAAEAIAKAEGA